MKKEALFRYVDHTALKAYVTWSDIQKLCTEALTFRMASVCIPSSYVKKAHDCFQNLKISTVIGFPLGNCSLAAKLAETRQALQDGADEFDMVINLGLVKAGMYREVEEEIRAVRDIIPDKILKVIIETCYLTDKEKIRMCQIVTDAKADYIKTSTGFGTAGAALEDVELIKKHIGPEVKIKASGGIRTRAEFEAYIEAGCSRIGTSSAICMLEE